MADAVVVPAVKIDLPADKALRLECLRLAARDAHLDDAPSTAAILGRANRYAAFVLDYVADEVPDAAGTGDAARG